MGLRYQKPAFGGYGFEVVVETSVDQADNMKRDMCKWCEDHVAPRYFNVYGDAFPSGAKNTTSTRFRFSVEQDALLFVLAFSDDLRLT